jgi:hypothetical protein
MEAMKTEQRLIEKLEELVKHYESYGLIEIPTMFNNRCKLES